MRIKQEFNPKNNTVVWQFEDNEHPLGIAMPFQTLLLISRGGMMDADDLRDILQQCPFPSTQSLSVQEDLDWIISAIGCLYDASLVALKESKEKGLLELEDEIKRHFTGTVTTIPTVLGYPAVIKSSACS